MKFVQLSLVFMFVFCSTINGQEAKAKRLETTKTQEHKKVAGTNLYLKIPKDFEQAFEFVGWNNKTGSSIVVSKRTKSITEVSDEIDQHLINLGYDIKSEQKKQLLLNGDNAIYFEVKKDSFAKKILLIKATNCIYVIEGCCNENGKENKSIKKAVLSAYIEN